MPLNMTNFVAALKEHYKPQRVKDMVYQKNPLLALMPKYEKFGGQNMPIPIIYGNPQGRSADFATAQGNKGNSSLEQFLLTRVSDYSLASITGEVIDASQSNADAFLRAATLEIDGAIHSLKRSMAIAMYRDGSGSIGQQSAADPAGARLLTLSNPEDITNFEVGMKLNGAATAVGAVIANFGGSGVNDVTITGIDRDAGTITVSETIHTDFPPSGFLFQEGDAQGGGASPIKMSGLEAWVPTQAVVTAGIPALFGVVRTSDVTRLGGNRFDASALPLEEGLIGAAARLAREGGSPDHCFVDFATYSNLEKALGSKVNYNVTKAQDADIGFSGMVIHGPRGAISVIPDQNCQPNVAWMLQLDTWALNTLGSAPKILGHDSLSMLRESASDAYEVRVGMYGNISCSAPGWNSRVALA